MSFSFFSPEVSKPSSSISFLKMFASVGRVLNVIFIFSGIVLCQRYQSNIEKNTVSLSLSTEYLSFLHARRRIIPNNPTKSIQFVVFISFKIMFVLSHQPPSYSHYSVPAGLGLVAYIQFSFPLYPPEYSFEEISHSELSFHSCSI